MELVIHVFDLALESSSAKSDATTALSISRVSKWAYQLAIPWLYRNPKLDQNNVDQFLRTVENPRNGLLYRQLQFSSSSSSLTSLVGKGSIFATFVRSLAFMTAPKRQTLTNAKRTHAYNHSLYDVANRARHLSAKTLRNTSSCQNLSLRIQKSQMQRQDDNDNGEEDGHDHVSTANLLRCLQVCGADLEVLCVDMACSRVACGFECPSRASRSGMDELLLLPNLRQLACRCPKGYMPPGMRKLLEQYALGQTESLVDLCLFWTAPGPFDSPGNVESLKRTLGSCPKVCNLSVVHSRQSSFLGQPELRIREIDVSNGNVSNTSSLERTYLSGASGYTQRIESVHGTSIASTGNQLLSTARQRNDSKSTGRRRGKSCLAARSSGESFDDGDSSLLSSSANLNSLTAAVFNVNLHASPLQRRRGSTMTVLSSEKINEQLLTEMEEESRAPPRAIKDTMSAAANQVERMEEMQCYIGRLLLPRKLASRHSDKIGGAGTAATQDRSATLSATNKGRNSTQTMWAKDEGWDAFVSLLNN